MSLIRTYHSRYFTSLAASRSSIATRGQRIWLEGTCHLHTTKAKKGNTIFSGIQPTGIPHLGNYLGALSNWVDMQKNADPADTILYCAVGYHAITLPQNPKTLREDRKNLLASLIAIGIDPQRSILFHQDQVLEHAELAWILNCICPTGKLQRMTTWKSKIAVARNANTEDEVNESHLNLGLFAYPVLQAADILLYKTNFVPVGEDQQQHLELTRELAEIFNRTTRSKTFPVPQHIIAPAKRILSLRDPTQKMSKSAPNVKSRILLTDDYSQITSKIRFAVTDSIPEIYYDPKSRPGVSNLLTILAACRGGSEDPQVLGNYYGAKNHSDLKQDVAGAIEERLGPAREEYFRIQKEDAWLQTIAEQGAQRARDIAQQTMKQVKAKLGLDSL
ncbi:Tryptophan--tRNA ligase, mitochondrial [Tulasnella sp. 419]|nr:Tryptophan--tRNA ligase, mitochondrial [Tulasnella sp. 419]